MFIFKFIADGLMYDTEYVDQPLVTGRILHTSMCTLCF
jgi:hypothetical protein